MLAANGISNGDVQGDKICFGPMQFNVQTPSSPVPIYQAIQNPDVFYGINSYTDGELSWNSEFNQELWGIEISETPYKSIYDPSPFGYQVMTPNAVNLLISLDRKSVV